MRIMRSISLSLLPEPQPLILRILLRAQKLMEDLEIDSHLLIENKNSELLL